MFDNICMHVCGKTSQAAKASWSSKVYTTQSCWITTPQWTTDGYTGAAIMIKCLLIICYTIRAHNILNSKNDRIIKFYISVHFEK